MKLAPDNILKCTLIEKLLLLIGILSIQNIINRSAINIKQLREKNDQLGIGYTLRSVVLNENDLFQICRQVAKNL